MPPGALSGTTNLSQSHLSKQAQLGLYFVYTHTHKADIIHTHKCLKVQIFTVHVMSNLLYIYFVLCLNFSQVFQHFGIKIVHLQICNLQIKEALMILKPDKVLRLWLVFVFNNYRI